MEHMASTAGLSGKNKSFCEEDITHIYRELGT